MWSRRGRRSRRGVGWNDNGGVCGGSGRGWRRAMNTFCRALSFNGGGVRCSSGSKYTTVESVMMKSMGRCEDRESSESEDDEDEIWAEHEGKTKGGTLKEGGGKEGRNKASIL